MRFRFPQVFFALMMLALLASVVPAGRRFGDSVRSPFSGIFAPVSWPSSRLAAALLGRFSSPPADPESPTNPRSMEQVVTENQQLRLDIASLTYQLEEYRQRDAERSRLGNLRDRVTPVTVTGGDSGTNETLRIAPLRNLTKDQPVLHSGGIAGRVASSSLTGGVVTLVTDRDMRFLGGFARFVTSTDGRVSLVPIATPPLRVSGNGNNTMVIRDLEYKTLEEAQIRPGDWIVLRDTDWPSELIGYRVGVVTAISQRRDAPLFAEIRIEPPTILSKLTQVMVMNR